MADVTRTELELLALGEMDPPEADALRARIAADPELAARLARVERDIAGEAPLPPLVLPAAEPAASGFPRWASLAGGLALLAAVVLLWVAAPSGGSGETFRGGLDLAVFRVRAGQVAPQDLVVRGREGDRVQWEARPLEGGYASAFDVQDDGEVSVWMLNQPVQAGQKGKGAAVLDAYPGAERVFVLVTPGPMKLEQFQEALKAVGRTPLAALDAVPGLPGVQRSFLIVEDP
ncbi:MAG: hypothetical protein H6736_16055 [Alphaproteobacteria bacterium]|nr:hypothetical protein [Alphaproteobacteria bacterium]